MPTFRSVLSARQPDIAKPHSPQDPQWLVCPDLRQLRTIGIDNDGIVGAAAHKEVQMGKIVGFVSKSELERLRIIGEARAIYDSIFPPSDQVGEQPDRAGRDGSTGLKRPAPPRENVR